MSTNPQKQLFLLLAQVNEQRSQVDKIANDARSHVSVIQAGMLPTIQELRQRIESEGVGTNPEAEDEYLDHLKMFRRLSQITPKVDTTVSTLAKSLSLFQILGGFDVRVYNRI